MYHVLHKWLSQGYLFAVFVDCVLFVFSFVLSLPFLVFILFVALPFHVVFKLVTHVAFACQNAKDGRRTVIHGTHYWWEEEVENGGMSYEVMIFDSIVEVEKIEQLVKKRVLPQHPKLKARLRNLPYTRGNIRCWVEDDKFNIKRHVIAKHVYIPNDQLKNYIRNLLTSDCIRDKPPWELRILSQCGETSPRDTVFVLCMHRNLLDGMQFIRYLCNTIPDVKPYRINITAPQRFQHFIRKVQALLFGPTMILFQFFNYKSSAKNFFSPKHDGREGSFVQWSTYPFSSKVEAIKTVAKCSTHCIFASAVSGAVHDISHNIHDHLPHHMQGVLKVAVNRKPIYAPLVVDLPVNVEGAIPRLWEVKHNFKTSCATHNPFVASTILAALTPFCSTYLHYWINSILEKPGAIAFNLSFGPSSRLVIGGSPLKTIHRYTALGHGHGLSVWATVYAGQICLTITTHPALAYLQNTILHNIQNQVDQMFALLKNRIIMKDKKERKEDLPADLLKYNNKELKLKLEMVQSELQRISELVTYSEEDMKLFKSLKREYSFAYRELKKRKNSTNKRRSSALLQSIESVRFSWKQGRRPTTPNAGITSTKKHELIRRCKSLSCAMQQSTRKNNYFKFPNALPEAAENKEENHIAQIVKKDDNNNIELATPNDFPESNETRQITVKIECGKPP